MSCTGVGRDQDLPHSCLGAFTGPDGVYKKAMSADVRGNSGILHACLAVSQKIDGS